MNGLNRIYFVGSNFEVRFFGLVVLVGFAELEGLVELVELVELEKLEKLFEFGMSVLLDGCTLADRVTYGLHFYFLEILIGHDC